MGKLSTYKPQTREVEVAGEQTITVRGLSISDVGEIMATHAQVLDKLYKEHIVDTFPTGDTPAVDTLAKALMKDAPEAMAAIIAHAADEPEEMDTVLSMPGLDQIKLLIEIASLTFHSEDDVKKVVEDLIAGMQVVTGAMNEMSLPVPSAEALPEA